MCSLNLNHYCLLWRYDNMNVGDDIKIYQITFIVTSPQHVCFGEWNFWERAPDSAEIMIMARLKIGTPRWWPPLSNGPTSVRRQPSLSADLRGRQRAAQSFWSSGCGPRICAMHLRDTATLTLDLPPLRVVLVGSPLDCGRACWEPWVCIRAGVSRQRESRLTRTQGTLHLPKTHGGPRPVWWKWAWSGALS